MASRYRFVDYDPLWPTLFAQEAWKLRPLLGEALICLHHVGSTSVPGLAAKPVIDMLPLVKDIMDVDALTPGIEAAGYRALGEYGLSGRRYFNRDKDGYRLLNIHIYAQDHPDAQRHLAFPAYLRAHPEKRQAYAELKQRVYAQYPDDIARYCDGKDAWIKATETQAMLWYQKHQEI